MKNIITIFIIIFGLKLSAQEAKDKYANNVIKTQRVSGFKLDINHTNNSRPLVNEVITPTGPSQEVGITEGSLSVSLAGAANYNIPFIVPKGINGVEPKIGLNYNSQAGNGIAGYGWEISGLSSITRIPSTIFHDGIIDPVDGDDLDRFALDGQRLILKTPTTGTYLTTGAVFETENFSNIKVTYIVTGAVGHFVVEYPDGSQAKYGNTTFSQTTTNFAITEWKNTIGIAIQYIYEIANNTNRIIQIKYGSLPNELAINNVNFEYSSRQRPEEGYVNGLFTKVDKKLSKIISNSSTVLYREYNLTYQITGTDYKTINYQRLDKVTESTIEKGIVKQYNPTVFTYGNSFAGVNYGNIVASLSVGNIDTRYAESVSGDFNGDGKMDFLLYPTTGATAKTKYWVFNDNTNSLSTLFDYEHNVGLFNKIIPMSMLNAPENNKYKLSKQQGWCVVKNINSSQTSFSTYLWDPVSIAPQYTRTFNFPFNVPNSADDEREYLSGDFNGDGLTDIIVVCKDTNLVESSVSKFFFLNLDRRIETNFCESAGTIELYYGSKYFVTDFNGDGKSDLLIIRNGIALVYTLNTNNTLVSICNFYNDNVSVDSNKIILFGDYNGDGKSDFLIPSAINSNIWNKFTSTGTSYIHESQTYQQFSYLTNTNLSNKHYISSDFNHDGKSDIILLSFDVTTTTATSGTASFKILKNVNGIFNGGFGLSNSITSPNTAGLNQFNLPITYSSDRPNESLEIGFIKGNKIYTFESLDDFNIDKQLQTITTGNGVKEVITYKPLKPAPEGSNPSYDNPNVYQSNNGQNPQYYPFVDIFTAPSLNVVSKLERFGNNYKKQFFTYYGSVQALNGLGLLGFQARMQTNWFDSDQTNQSMISNVSMFNMSLRGANTLNFSAINYWYNLEQVPSSFLSKNIITYNIVNGVFVNPLLANKVFKLIQTKKQDFDGLKNTSSESNIVYNGYNDPTSIASIVKNGTTIEQTSTTAIAYYSPVSSPYIIDQISNKQSSVTAYFDTRTTEEQYTYTALNQVETIKSKSMTSDFITKSYEYDAYGNTKKETINAPDLLVPRIANFVFDPIYSGRFLTKATDIENLETNYTYNNTKGTLLTETNPYNLTTTHSYDAWGKKIAISDYLNNTIAINYSKTANNTFSITKTMPALHGGASIEVFDLLGRKIISGKKNMQGVFGYVKTDYDNLDRVVKKYEPYFLNGATLYSYSPTIFSQLSYDYLNRLSTITHNSGKTETISYNGLSTMVTTLADGLSKNKSSIIDAIGNLKNSIESPQGGTIFYNYFANNEIKTTSYSGNTITSTLDSWGRKSSIKDPSAGLYGYTYNNLGEILTETTPKGVTTYNYDNFGKILTETVVGKATTNLPTTTNTLTTNVYNSSKLLESTTFNDIENNIITSYEYSYNTAKQPNKVIETSPMSRFETEVFYDTFSRPLNQKQKAATIIAGTTTVNKQIEKWTTNVYQNGELFKITDGKTTTGSGATLWQINEVNARDQIIKGQFGNNIYVQNQFEELSGKLINLNHSDSSTAGGQSFFQMSYNFTNNPQRNLYSSRTFNHLNNYTENFTFDNLDRLTSYPNELGVSETQTYAANGRISSNSNGTYNYSTPSKPYRNTSIDVNATSKNYYLNSSLQRITYNALKKPTSIYQETTTGVAKERIDFLYHVGNNKSVMFYGDTNTNKLLRKFRRYYSSGGTMEITEERNSSGTIINTNFTTYIGGDAYSAPVALKGDEVAQNYIYLHRDNLGSILAISNQNKVMIEKRVFDAWGNLIKLMNSSGQYVINNGQIIIANYNLFLDRGYTGHEHLIGVGLINMNGRLYDPKLHRFLMPDNNLQDPTNSQNFNRYGYVLNNPLMYIDSSGEDHECPECGDEGGGMFGWIEDLSNVAQVVIGFAVGSIALSWDELGIKDWSNRNLSFNKWGDFAKSVGDFYTNNISSTIKDGKNFLNNTFRNLFKGNKSPEATLPQANSYSFAPNGGTSSYVSSFSTSPGGGYNNNVEVHPYVPPQAMISMPTQHHFLGANMTAMSDGNFFQQMVYNTANSFNVVGQYLMGRGVGDSSMRNLNGTATTTDEGVMAFGSMPLMLAGGEGAGASLNGFSTSASTKLGQYVLRNSRYFNNNNWIRLGKGQLGSNHYMRLSLGAGKKAYNQMPSGILKNFNAWLRTWGQEGHFYYKNWKW